MLNKLEIIIICIYMLKIVKYAKIFKISLHNISNLDLDFMNRIYIISTPV